MAVDPNDPYVQFLLTFKAPSKELEDAVNTALSDAAHVGGTATFQDMGKTAVAKLLDDGTVSVFRTVAKSEGQATAARLTSEVRRAVATSLIAGEDLDAMRKRVTGVFDRFTRAEAERIAETESMTAYNKGAELAMRQSGITEVEVDVSADACPRCTPLAGRRFPIDQAPKLPLDTHPRCKCILKAVLPEAS